MIRCGWRAALGAAVCVLLSAEARADVTAFLGVNGSPESRAVTGFSGGMTFVAFGFEGEYASTRESLDDVAPQLRTYMANGFVQNPIPISGLTFWNRRCRSLSRDARRRQPDQLAPHRRRVKIDLAGPLHPPRLPCSAAGRGPRQKPQRLYAGVNLKFPSPRDVEGRPTPRAMPAPDGVPHWRAIPAATPAATARCALSTTDEFCSMPAPAEPRSSRGELRVEQRRAVRWSGLRQVTLRLRRGNSSTSPVVALLLGVEALLGKSARASRLDALLRRFDLARGLPYSRAALIYAIEASVACCCSIFARAKLASS
jgi:hypothetical protein